MSFHSITLDDNGNSIDHATTSPLGDGPQSEADLIRVRPSGGVSRVTMSDNPSLNSSTNAGVTRVSQDQLAASSRILDGAHTPAGRPIPRAQVEGHHIVSINGMTMRAMDAHACGLLDVTPEGRYVEVGSVTREREPADKSEEPAPAAGKEQTAAERDQQFLNDVVAVDPGYAGELHNEAIEAAVNGTGTAFDAARVASALDITPAQAEARFSGMVETYQSYVDGAVTAAGVADVSAFYNFLRSERPDSLRDALRRVSHDGNVSDFEQMARAYVAQGHAPAQTSDDADDAPVEYDAEDIMSAEFGNGISAGKGSDGTVFLLIPGRGVVKASDAIRDGLVKLSGR